MNKKTEQFRKQLADLFLQTLEEKQFNWQQGYRSAGSPMNAITKKAYRGVNRFNLTLVSMARKYNDTRWATFNQIKERGWKLQNAKGQGVPLEYWFPYDREERKMMSWSDFNILRLTEGIGFGDRYILTAKYFTVFNGSLIDGIPELKVQRQNANNVEIDSLVKTISEKMGVKIINDSLSQPHYRLNDDEIHMPAMELYNSSYDYNSEALHELTHSTGAKHRLNRDIGHKFGSPEYAFEELVAEIGSALMSTELQVQPTEAHIKNHQAYVGTWLKEIREKPEKLTQAIKLAEQAASYMDMQAGIIQEAEFDKTVESSMDVKKDMIAAEQEIPEQKEPVLKFDIYQVKSGDEQRDLRFTSFYELMKSSGKVDRGNYDLVYSANMPDTDKDPWVTTKNLFHKFTHARQRPKDYTGRPLSVSDVIVITRNGVEKAFYCDRHSFMDVPEFISGDNVLRVTAASYSNFKGMVVLCDFRGNVYLGNRSDYDNAGCYDNCDHPALFISKNEVMYHMLGGKGLAISLQEAFDRHFYTPEDIDEYRRVVATLSAKYEMEQDFLFNGESVLPDNNVFVESSAAITDLLGTVKPEDFARLEDSPSLKEELSQSPPEQDLRQAEIKEETQQIDTMEQLQ